MRTSKGIQAPASDTDEVTGSVKTEVIGLEMPRILVFGAIMELKTNSSENSECDAVTRQQHEFWS